MTSNAILLALAEDGNGSTRRIERVAGQLRAAFQEVVWPSTTPTYFRANAQQ